MMQRLKKSWRDLKAAKPGERFQERYHRSTGEGALRRVLYIGGGILVMAAGVFFLPAPGPGMLILVVGAGLIAEQSLIAARALDWMEIRLRRFGKWGRRAWRAVRRTR